MVDRDRPNPFTESRVTIASTHCPTSLLAYGEQNFTLFKRLKQNKRLYSSQVVGNDQEAEQKILWRYKKQYYAVDESGHSLAEQALDRKLQEQTPQTQDFWRKINTSFHRSSKPNPFNNSETASTVSMSSNTSTKNMKTWGTGDQSLRTERQLNRLQITKMQKTINTSKRIQQTQKNDEKFSLVNMYKSKKVQETKTKRQHPQTIVVRQQQYFNIPLG